MTIQKLASAIAFREGKKSQARIYDIREILKVICELEAEDCIANGAESKTSPLQALTEATNKKIDKMRKRRKKAK